MYTCSRPRTFKERVTIAAVAVAVAVVSRQLCASQSAAQKLAHSLGAEANIIPRQLCDLQQVDGEWESTGARRRRFDAASNSLRMRIQSRTECNT